MDTEQETVSKQINYAKRIFAHYITAVMERCDLPVDDDTLAEIGDAIDCIIAAAVTAATPKQVKHFRLRELAVDEQRITLVEHKLSGVEQSAADLARQLRELADAVGSVGGVVMLA